MNSVRNCESASELASVGIDSLSGVSARTIKGKRPSRTSLLCTSPTIRRGVLPPRPVIEGRTVLVLHVFWFDTYLLDCACDIVTIVPNNQWTVFWKFPSWFASGEWLKFIITKTPQLTRHTVLVYRWNVNTLWFNWRLRQQLPTVKQNQLELVHLRNLADKLNDWQNWMNSWPIVTQQIDNFFQFLNPSFSGTFTKSEEVVLNSFKDNFSGIFSCSHVWFQEIMVFEIHL